MSDASVDILALVQRLHSRKHNVQETALFQLYELPSRSTQHYAAMAAAGAIPALVHLLRNSDGGISGKDVADLTCGCCGSSVRDTSCGGQCILINALGNLALGGPEVSAAVVAGGTIPVVFNSGTACAAAAAWLCRKALQTRC